MSIAISDKTEVHISIRSTIPSDDIHLDNHIGKKRNP